MVVVLAVMVVMVAAEAKQYKCGGCGVKQYKCGGCGG